MVLRLSPALLVWTCLPVPVAADNPWWFSILMMHYPPACSSEQVFKQPFWEGMLQCENYVEVQMITWAIQISCIVLALVYWRKRFPTDVMNRHICKVLTCEQHCSPCKIICSIFTNTDNEKGNKAKFGWISFCCCINFGTFTFICPVDETEWCCKGDPQSQEEYAAQPAQEVGRESPV